MFSSKAAPYICALTLKPLSDRLMDTDSSFVDKPTLWLRSVIGVKRSASFLGLCLKELGLPADSSLREIVSDVDDPRNQLSGKLPKSTA